MAQLTGYKLHRILARFPWRRRKPRSAQKGRPPIGFISREGQQLWADPSDLASFEDPAPALVCVALHADVTGHVLLRALVEHHAELKGTELPQGIPELTRVGLELISELLNDAQLDPDETIGVHPLGELLTATWAIAAAGTMT